MKKVPKSAWKSGAFWKTITSHGELEAIIVGPSKVGHKIVSMRYISGSSVRLGEIRQSYSHAHMLRHFEYTGEVRKVPDEQT